MSLENYEGTALTDYIESQNENNEPENVPAEPEQTEVVETVEPTEGGETTPKPEPEEITSVNIPGLGEISFDDIKEWRNGNMRQSDYTRKTQELARQRETLQDAENLYNYVNSNPQVLEVLRKTEGGNVPQVNNASPENQAIKQLIRNQTRLETDIKLKDLHDRYGEFDEISLLNKATELRTTDLEFVLNGIKQSAPRENVDIDAIRKQAYEDAKKDLKAELEANRNNTSTIISTNQSATPPPKPELSAAERRVAAGMGLSEAEYLKWR